MAITEELLLENGFEKRYNTEGEYYVKGKVAIVKNIKWLPCNYETGFPLNTGGYINTMEELAELAKEANVSI